MSLIGKLRPFRPKRPQTVLDALARSGDLPWQRPRRLHEQKDKLLFDALRTRLSLVIDHSNNHATRLYFQDAETGQIWEMRDADIGHTTDVVLAPVDAIPAEPLPRDA